MKSSTKALVVISGLALGGLASYQWLTQYNRPSLDISQYCLLSTKPCVQEQVVISLNKDKLHPLTEIELTSLWPKAQGNKLQLELKGLEMDMGVVKFNVPHIGGDTFKSTILLPACSHDKMTWIGQLSDGKQSRDVALIVQRNN